MTDENKNKSLLWEYDTFYCPICFGKIKDCKKCKDKGWIEKACIEIAEAQHLAGLEDKVKELEQALSGRTVSCGLCNRLEDENKILREAL